MNALTEMSIASAKSSPVPLAPRPLSSAETGLGEDFLTSLALKHLYAAGVLTLRQLADRIALSGSLLEPLLDSLKGKACLEVRSGSGSDTSLRYALTDRGRAAALEALLKSGYIGPAPVPLADYARVVQAQSVRHRSITHRSLHQAFAEVVIRKDLLDRLGPALHSGKALFVHGPPGTGKTYIAKRLAQMLGDTVLLPHAIAIGDTVVQFFDPVIHRPVDPAPAPASLLMQGHDPRYVLCRRPVVITGGELTLDMLEPRYDANAKIYHAPIQLKANTGALMIDDLGRQRASTEELLNRWIIPLEEHRDYLSVGAGQHFPVPFDVVLIFSTNLNPLELADEAFLRRLGYKIRFDYLSTAEYGAIWRQVCAEKAIPFDTEVLDYALGQLHARLEVPLLPCHPRDLLDLIQDRCRYLGVEARAGIEDLRWAWENYFVQLTDG